MWNLIQIPAASPESACGGRVDLWSTEVQPVSDHISSNRSCFLNCWSYNHSTWAAVCRLTQEHLEFILKDSAWWNHLVVFPSKKKTCACFHPLCLTTWAKVWPSVRSRWAWCSVNTRSVFMSHPSNDFLRGQDVYALAPFLDLLNHRPDVQVNCWNG